MFCRKTNKYNFYYVKYFRYQNTVGFILKARVLKVLFFILIMKHAGLRRQTINLWMNNNTISIAF